MMRLLIIAFIILSVRAAWFSNSDEQTVSTRPFSCQFNSTDGRSYDLANIRPSGAADPRSKATLEFCNPESNPMTHPDQWYLSEFDLSDTILDEVWSNTHGLLYFSIRKQDSSKLNLLDGSAYCNKVLLICGKVEDITQENNSVVVFSPSFCPTNTFDEQEALSKEVIQKFTTYDSLPDSFKNSSAVREMKYEQRLANEKKRKEEEAMAIEKIHKEAKKRKEEEEAIAKEIIRKETQIAAEVTWLNSLLGLVLLASGSVLVFFGRIPLAFSSAFLGAATYMGLSIYAALVSLHHSWLDGISPSFYLIVVLACLVGSHNGLMVSRIPAYNNKYTAVVNTIGLVSLLLWLPCYLLVTHFVADYALLLLALLTALCLLLACLAIETAIRLQIGVNRISLNVLGCISAFLGIRFLTDTIYLPLSFDDELGFIARTTTPLTASLSLLVNALAILKMINCFYETVKEDKQ